MHSFTCDVVKKRARCKQRDQTGELTLRTKVNVGDGYRVQPVEVSVEYEASFMPDREFWDYADDDPEERYPIYHLKTFSTPEERQSYCSTFYQLLPAPLV